MKTHKHELAVQALHQQHDIGPIDQNAVSQHSQTKFPEFEFMVALVVVKYAENITANTLLLLNVSFHSPER